MSTTGPGGTGFSFQTKPHAYDPLRDPQLFDGVLARRTIAFIIDVVIISIPIIFAGLFILIFGVSYSPLGWALPSEVFPNATRSKGVALSTCVNWLSNFIVGVVTPPMMSDIGYRTYVFFAVWCVLAGVWAFLLVPETSGKTLDGRWRAVHVLIARRHADRMATLRDAIQSQPAFGDDGYGLA